MSASANLDRMHRRKFLAQSSRGAVGFSLLSLAACSHWQPTASNSKGTARPMLAGLENEIAKRMEEAKVPGLSIAIIKDGTLFWRGSFGIKDSASRESVDNDTLFEAASVSKTIFAYAVMKLCEKGV